MVAVDLFVAGNAQATDVHRAGDGTLVDGGRVEVAVPQRVDDVHRADDRVGHSSRVPLAADDKPDRPCQARPSMLVRLRV
jgi:hypothetical protein